MLFSLLSSSLPFVLLSRVSLALFLPSFILHSHLFQACLAVHRATTRLSVFNIRCSVQFPAGQRHGEASARITSSRKDGELTCSVEVTCGRFEGVAAR